MFPSRRTTQQKANLVKMRADVEAFLPQIPYRMSIRTYQVKQDTGRHCTLAALQKYVKGLYTDYSKTPYDSLPFVFQTQIASMVADAYKGMKEARTYE